VWGHGAWDWVIVVAAYAVGLGGFRSLGGLPGAARAVTAWGAKTSEKRARKLGLSRGR
jgi:hypothetical protein